MVGVWPPKDILVGLARCADGREICCRIQSLDVKGSRVCVGDFKIVPDLETASCNGKTRFSCRQNCCLTVSQASILPTLLPQPPPMRNHISQGKRAAVHKQSALNDQAPFWTNKKVKSPLTAIQAWNQSKKGRTPNGYKSAFNAISCIELLPWLQSLQKTRYTQSYSSPKLRRVTCDGSAANEARWMGAW